MVVALQNWLPGAVWVTTAGMEVPNESFSMTAYLPIVL